MRYFINFIAPENYIGDSGTRPLTNLEDALTEADRIVRELREDDPDSNWTLVVVDEKRVERYRVAIASPPEKARQKDVGGYLN